MTPLVLVGAGGFARETVELVHACNAGRPQWDLLGYLDDDANLHGSVRTGMPVLGPVDAVRDLDAMVVVCVGSPRDQSARQRVVEWLALPADRYATLVHPSAVVARSARLGPGTVLHATTVLTADVVIGAHVAVMPGVVFTHDDVVGDYATFGAGVRLAGGVHVGTAAYIGSGAMVREQLCIGARALVGMGAVVTRSVPPGEVWAGAPARRVRMVSSPRQLRPEEVR